MFERLTELEQSRLVELVKRLGWKEVDGHLEFQDDEFNDGEVMKAQSFFEVVSDALILAYEF